MKYLILFSFFFISNAFATPYDDAKAELELFLYQYRVDPGHKPFIAKARLMFDLVMKTRPDICVEIGVETGATVIPTAIALKHLGSGVIYGIDPWYSPSTPNSPSNQYDGVLDLIQQWGVEDYCIILPVTSQEAASSIPECIDILHIDGDHSIAGMNFDTFTYFPKVKVGGYIWFDDVGYRDNGPTATSRRRCRAGLRSMHWRCARSTRKACSPSTSASVSAAG